MSKQKYSLICVAHPDDESIFFAGLVLQRRTHPWRVICMTDGNADGQGKKRRKQFEKAAEILKIEEVEWWAFPDVFEQRLPVKEISSRLQELPDPTEIFTHGIIGEYGHPHHQDVSYATHDAFREHSKIYSVAYNCYPDLVIQLNKKQYELKARLLTEIYGSETTRFLHLLPATFAEGFFKADMKEIEMLYDFLAHNKPLRESIMNHYSWLTSNLKANRSRKRPF